MENKERNTVVKTIGILGVIFCLVSLLTPWSSSAFTFGIFGNDHSTPLYADFFTNQTIRESSFFNQAFFFAICMIIILVLILSALVLGIFCVSDVEHEKPNSYLLTSCLLIVSVMLYITAVSIWSGSSTYVGSTYSSGFVTAVIAFIIFFILFIFQSVFHQEIVAIEKTKSENEAMNILKSRYVKGEITKKEYEQMKKDIED